jgi:large subunit ribosomal protein L33
MVKKIARLAIRLVSMAGTGFEYITMKNPKNTMWKLRLVKYDPVLRQRVLFKVGLHCNVLFLSLTLNRKRNLAEERYTNALAKVLQQPQPGSVIQLQEVSDRSIQLYYYKPCFRNHEVIIRELSLSESRVPQWKGSR